MKLQNRFKHIENCLCNPLFRKLFNVQATVIMYIAVLNFITADCRSHPRWNKRRIFKINIWKCMCNWWNYYQTCIYGERRIHPMPSKWKVYLNRSLAWKIPPKCLKWHKTPCFRIQIPRPTLILDAHLTTMH